MRRLLVIGSALSLAACSTVGKGVGDTFRMTGNGMGDAVVAPLKDLNLVKSTVPPILAQAAEDPYRLPERTDCAYLAYEIAQLDLALGPDLDVPRDADQTSLRTRGSIAASDALISAVRDVTTGWMPFRSVVRRLTGAADRQDAMEDAVHAGGVRRGYLKGLGLQQDCAHPAAPLPESVVAEGPALQKIATQPADAAAAEAAEDTASESSVQPVALAPAPPR